MKKIQKHFNSKEKFTFIELQEDKMIKIIKELPKNKANALKDTNRENTPLNKPKALKKSRNMCILRNWYIKSTIYKSFLY